MTKKEKHTEVDETDFIGRGFTASDMLCLLKAGAAKGVRAAREGGSVPADSLSVLKEEVETASPPKTLPTVSIAGHMLTRGYWEQLIGPRMKQVGGFEVMLKSADGVKADAVKMVAIDPFDSGAYFLAAGGKVTLDYDSKETGFSAKYKAILQANFDAATTLNKLEKTRARPTRRGKTPAQPSKSSG